MRIDVLLVTTEKRTGAFITTLQLVDHLRQAGHDVRVNPDTPGGAVTVCHLGDPRAGSVPGPLVLMVHGANPRYRRRLPPYDRAWFPSNNLRRWYLNPPRSVVLPPPVDPYDYLTDPGKHVTLSQVSPAKGSSRLRLFAKALPDIPFLAVQAAPARRDLVLERLPNVTVVPRFADARDMFSLTRLLVMPLGGLSWGRVAVEASVSGIPTIATVRGGIREAMGDGATYVPEAYVHNWVRTIRTLWDDPAAYAAASAAAQRRGDRIMFENDMANLMDLVVS